MLRSGMHSPLLYFHHQLKLNGYTARQRSPYGDTLAKFLLQSREQEKLGLPFINCESEPLVPTTTTTTNLLNSIVAPLGGVQLVLTEMLRSKSLCVLKGVGMVPCGTKNLALSFFLMIFMLRWQTREFMEQNHTIADLHIQCMR